MGGYIHTTKPFFDFERETIFDAYHRRVRLILNPTDYRARLLSSTFLNPLEGEAK